MYQKCWICDEILKDVVYLPEVDEFFGDNVPIFKSTFNIKDVVNLNFCTT